MRFVLLSQRARAQGVIHFVARIKKNFEQIELKQEDIDTLVALRDKHGHTRFNIPFTYHYAPYDLKWDINIFNEPVEKVAGNQINVGA